jgi:hypothetical protein
VPSTLIEVPMTCRAGLVNRPRDAVFHGRGMINAAVKKGFWKSSGDSHSADQATIDVQDLTVDEATPMGTKQADHRRDIIRCAKLAGRIAFQQRLEG